MTSDRLVGSAHWLHHFWSDFLVRKLEWRGRLVNGEDLASLGQLFLGQPRGVAVEGGVGEEARRRSRVVENVEPELAVVVAYACPAR